MSLFAEDTVIIVGAGASVPFGLPTGAEMIDLIVKEFRDEAKNVNPDGRGPGVLEQIPEEAPITYAVQFEGNGSQRVNLFSAQQNLQDLAEWLEQQTGDSIDDIIRHNPKKSLELKVCICKVLFDRIYNFDKARNTYVPRPLSNRFVSTGVKAGDSRTKSRNWIHHLINLARSQLVTRREDGFHPSSKIKIISFNYDGILEHVLDRKWKNIETEFGDWSDHIEIAHPHGTIQMKNSVERQDVATFLRESAQKISVVHDNNEQCHPEVSNDRKRALAFCWRAADVYAIGFAFARANVELIGLDSKVERNGSQASLCDDGKMSKGLIHYINYDDSFGLRSRVKEVCNRASSANPNATFREMGPKEMTAGPGRKLEISEAIIAGFLGEMPA